MMRSKLLITATAIMGVWACGAPDRSNADWSVKDSTGVTIVSNHPKVLSRGCVTISPTPETTIYSGEVGNSEVPVLMQVQGGAALNDGRIVVLNRGSRELLFYGPDGRWLQTVGRAGRGPGEFVNPTWLGHGGNDTLFVWDGPQMRLSTYDATGTLVGQDRMEGQSAPPAIGGRFTDGSFLSLPGQMAFFPPGSGTIRLPEIYGRYDVTNGRVTTLAEGRSLETTVGAEGRYSVPFGKSDRAVAHGDVLVVGDNGFPSLQHFAMDGQLRRIVEWTSDPKPVTDRDRAAYTRYLSDADPRFAPPADAVFANDRPVFSSLVSDRTGWLWVKKFSGGWEPPSPWLVLDQRGVLQCEVVAPDRIAVLEIGEGYLLGLQRDENGEETVARYSLTRTKRSESR